MEKLVKNAEETVHKYVTEDKWDYGDETKSSAITKKLSDDLAVVFDYASKSVYIYIYTCMCECLMY